MKLIEQQDKIVRMYLDEKKSIRAIARLLDCSMSGIKSILHKNNVKMRNKCESLNLCPDSFSEEEFDIVFGTTLGDGHITKKRGPKGECQLYVGHGLKQSDYLNWKYQKMLRFVSGMPYELKHYLKSNKKTYITLNFITRKSSLFTKMREAFYPEGKKVIPCDFEDKINAKSLAIWYMDDGYRYKNKNNIEIHTQCFTHEDQLRILKILKKKFGIVSHIRTLPTRKEIVFIPSASCGKFLQVVNDHIVPSMRYKGLSSEAITSDMLLKKHEDRVRSARKLVEIT